MLQLDISNLFVNDTLQVKYPAIKLASNLGGNARGKVSGYRKRKIFLSLALHTECAQCFFRGFSGNSKQILTEILSKMNILAELDRTIPELGKDFG